MKKALSLILALTLCLGLAVPALAAIDSYGYRLGEYSLIGASEEPVGTQTFTHYFWGIETEALVFPAGTVISTVSANNSHKFIACVYDITDVEYDAELVEKAKENGFKELGIPKVATKVRNFALEPGALYEICVVYGEMQESVFVATPAESVGTEDVYLLGDGTATRMAPAFYWDAPFTGTSTETVLGKEVTVWHFPADAKVGLDNWVLFPHLVAVYVEDDDSDGVYEENPVIETYLFESGQPFALPYTDMIYRLSLYDIDDKLYGEYYVTADSDPTISNWAKEEVNAARAAGLIPELTGDPGYKDTITREQFAELIVNFVEKHGVTITAGDESFTDCDNPAVVLAASAGIVNGIGNGKFDPNAATNREQIATMFYRAMGYIEAQTGQNPASVVGSIAKYSDKGAVSAWAVEGVGVLASNGIMKGTSDTTLAPKSPCTVEQSILLVYRLYEAYLAN